MIAIGIDTIRLAPAITASATAERRRNGPRDRDRRQTDPEPAARRQHGPHPVREREPEEPESRDRDPDHDRPEGDRKPAARSATVGQRPGQRQDEPSEVEVDGGQQDDRRREAERLDAEAVE